MNWLAPVKMTQINLSNEMVVKEITLMRKVTIRSWVHFGGKGNEWGVSKDLWAKVFEGLPTEQRSLLEKAGIEVKTISGKREFSEELLKTAREAQAKCEEKRWKLKWGQREIDVREKAEAITGWIEKFKHVGDVATQFDPVHTALPWTGVRFILTIFINGEQNMAAAIVGVERGCSLISSTQHTAGHRESNVKSLELGKRTLEDLKNPGQVLEKMCLLDKPELALGVAADVVEKCFNQKEFNALKELVKGFEPIIGRIASITTAMCKIIEVKEKKSSDGSRRSHTKTIMTLHRRGVLMRLENGYFGERSFVIGGKQRIHRYYGYMGFVRPWCG
ncbi:hypothetical protein BDZ91DRAFT_453854 [Kalaharituber pfeilii]|nr:hypothetical protein BDZ91DRAFT_453854 [Kalaharituber pfeilii]